MTPDPRQPELAEAHLRGLLSTLGLDVEYVRGERDTLYYRDLDGHEVPVLDFVGGYGSLILGHHHPEIVACAEDLLRRQVPVHAQFSYHPYANELAAALNRVLWREFGTDEPYFAIFANSGAEAVECALKHAELERGRRAAELAAEVETHLELARAAVRGGRARLADEARERLGQIQDIDALAHAVRGHNEHRLQLPPLFLALEGSFHGKLGSSVQLTHNPGYRLPFRGLAAQARFIPTDRPGAVAKVLEAERVTMLDVRVEHDVVRLVERDLPVVAAFFVEPIQGEGGIRVLDRRLAEEIRAAADAGGFPVVVDEIQSGVGRTGAFFASSHLGLRGDYYALAKSLGGGVVKSSVLLIREGRYQKDFELVHSSTFAKDALSCHIGLRVVQVLESDGGRAYAIARERGEALAAALHAVAVDYPDVVQGVRGRGLMLGMEFRDQSDSSATLIRDYARNGLLGYLFAGYLLRAHRIRVFPTASATHTLRFEPSLYLTDDAIEQLTTGLREMCRILRDHDDTALLPG